MSSKVRWTANWIKRKIRTKLEHVVTFIANKCNAPLLTIKSLCYNDHLDRGYVIDTLMEPLFWFVDHFTEALGPIFVFLVVVTLFVYVSIAYIIGLPFWLERSYVVTVIALIIGNWLLVNVTFNYWMALTTSPGHPPPKILLKEVSSICKKCISPKPPRAHHCSICNKCILKMDHHCRKFDYFRDHS